MKYKVEPVINREHTFTPFKVTFTIETKEEFERFHDDIMSQITGVDNHEMHGAIYKGGTGSLGVYKGDV